MDQSVLEAIRRRAGQVPSGAGIAGGMPATNTPSPANPIAAMGMAQQSSSTAPQGVNPAGSSPSDGAISAMKGAQPGEATIIVKALIDRLKNSPPSM